MSWIDLTADVRWSEREIVDRMEAMIRQAMPATEEQILTRKILGALVSLLPGVPPQLAYTLAPHEMQEVMQYAKVLYLAQQAGRQARADMAVLQRVLQAERFLQPLDPADEEGAALFAARAAARAPALVPGPTEEPQL